MQVANLDKRETHETDCDAGNISVQVSPRHESYELSSIYENVFGRDLMVRNYLQAGKEASDRWLITPGARPQTPFRPKRTTCIELQRL